MNKLEQAAREVIRQHSMECLSDKTIAALREALAELDIEEMTLTQIAARHEQAEQEPVAWTRKQFGEDREYCEEPFTTDWKPLFAAPVRTKDLTDDELDIFVSEKTMDMRMTLREFARSVIAADREKNK